MILSGRLATVRPVRVAALVFAAYVVLAGVMLHHRHGDPASFIVAGENFAARDSLVSPIPVIAKSPGYDGQFYYRLALNPFTSKPTDYGITLDDPATRGARIGYPFLAWLVSFGEPRLLPWALILVNLAGLFAIAWASVDLVWARGLPFWLGLGAPFYPGFIITLWRDTTEIVAGGFEMAALNLACRRRFWWAAAPACCALVTRETSLLTLSGFGVAEAATCLRRRQWSWNLVPLALPAAVHVVWQAFVAWHWNRPSYISLTKDLSFPFTGFAVYVKREMGALRDASLAPPVYRLHLGYLALGTMCLALIGISGVLVVRRRADIGLSLTYLAYVALAACFSAIIWNEAYGSMRAFSDCFVVSATVVALSRETLAVSSFLLLTAVMWAVMICYVFYIA